MAGDWIPMRTELHEDPAVVRLCKLSGLDSYAVTGRLLRFWSWASRELVDGVALVEPDWIDRMLEFPGFAAMLEEVGWLRFLYVAKGGKTVTLPSRSSVTGARAGARARVRGACAFAIPHWDNWLSKGAKKRLLEARRARNYRETQAFEKTDRHASVTVERDASVTTGEERREEGSTPPKPPIPLSPPQGEARGKVRRRRKQDQRTDADRERERKEKELVELLRNGGAKQ